MIQKKLIIFLKHKTLFHTGHCAITNLVYNNLGLKNELSIDEVEKDLEILGKKFKEYPFEFETDLNHIDDAIIYFVQFYCPVPKTKSEIKVELEKIQKTRQTAKALLTTCLVENNFD